MKIKNQERETGRRQRMTHHKTPRVSRCPLSPEIKVTLMQITKIMKGTRKIYQMTQVREIASSRFLNCSHLHFDIATNIFGATFVFVDIAITWLSFQFNCIWIFRLCVDHIQGLYMFLVKQIQSELQSAIHTIQYLSLNESLRQFPILRSQMG